MENALRCKLCFGRACPGAKAAQWHTSKQLGEKGPLVELECEKLKSDKVKMGIVVGTAISLVVALNAGPLQEWLRSICGS
jgi:hypothetical protein